MSPPLRWRRAVSAIAFVLASPTILAADSRLDNFATRALAAHNRERDTLGLPRLEWSETLAEGARDWAGRLSRIGYLAHSEDSPDDPDPPGENLWAGTRGSYTVEQMIAFWTDERVHFRNGRFPDNSTTGELEDVGHYTQIVWRATTRVGCAIADNGEDEYLVCRYKVAGNVIGEMPY